jgi:hypothetical protein
MRLGSSATQQVAAAPRFRTGGAGPPWARHTFAPATAHAWASPPTCAAGPNAAAETHPRSACPAGEERAAQQASRVHDPPRRLAASDVPAERAAGFGGDHGNRYGRAVLGLGCGPLPSAARFAASSCRLRDHSFVAGRGSPPRFFTSTDGAHGGLLELTVPDWDGWGVPWVGFQTFRHTCARAMAARREGLLERRLEVPALGTGAREPPVRPVSGFLRIAVAGWSEPLNRQLW